MKGREQDQASDPSAEVIVALVEALEKVEYVRVIGDRLLKVRGRPPCLLFVVFGYREVPLDEGLEGGVEVESTSLASAEELLLNGNLDLTGSATMLANDVLQLNCYRPEDLEEDHTIHLSPGGDSEGCCVDEDVVVQGVML